MIDAQKAAAALHDHAKNLPEPHATFLRIRAGAFLAKGTVLADCIERGYLADVIVDVLHAIPVLRWVALPTEQWALLRWHLDGARLLLKGGWDGMSDLMPSDDPDREAFRTVDRRLEAFEQYSEAALRRIQDAGYDWDWKEGRLTRASGGRPRSLLRDLVRALVTYRQRERMPWASAKELCGWTAEQLAPFLSSSLLDTRKNSPLYDAVKAELK